MLKVCEELRQAVLQEAIQGKLTKQLPSDGDARTLLERIKAEKEKLIKEKKIKKEKPLAPITDDEIPFDIPENWCWVRLGEVGLTNIGLTYKPTDISLDGTIVLRSCNIQNEKMAYDDIVKVSCDIAEKNYAKAGDILICVRNGSRKLVGKCAIVDKDGMAFGAFMAVFRSRVNRYVKYFLNSSFFRQDLDGVYTTTINQITQDMLKKQLFPLPPLSEQERIVAKLEKLMAEIDELEKVEAELVEQKKDFPGDMKAALLQEAMQGKLTKQLPSDGDARDLLEQIRAEKNSLIATGRYKKEKALKPITEDEIPFDIPTNWQWERLGNLGFYKKGPFGSALTKSMFVEKGDDTVKVYEQKNAIQKNHELGEYYISRDYYESKMKGFTVYPNDIIVSCAGTIGESYVMPDNIEVGIINQALMRIKLVESMLVEYYLLYFDFVIKVNSSEKSKGSAIKNIPPFDIFKNMLIPIPPLAEQERIVAKLEKLLPLCDGLAEE